MRGIFRLGFSYGAGLVIGACGGMLLIGAVGAAAVVGYSAVKKWQSNQNKKEEEV